MTVAAPDTNPDKAALRARLLADRRTVCQHVHDVEARALGAHVGGLVAAGSTVCAYVPVGTEPGSTAMLDAVARRGVRVLLPVVHTAADGTPLPLLWGEYRPGHLEAGPFGLLEPAPPALPATTLGDAELILVPALAVDRRGARLGRGAGFYDRSLGLRAPGARLVAVVRDRELLDELPAESHDVPMTHAITPGRGVVALAPEFPDRNSGSST